MVSLTRDLGARALALSISASSAKGAGAIVRRVRRAIPRRAALVVGGAGAPAAAGGVTAFDDLRGLLAWARDLGQN
jgi:hypothetical protein